MPRSRAAGIQVNWPAPTEEAPLGLTFEIPAGIGEAPPKRSLVSRTIRFLRQLRSVRHMRLWLVQFLNRLIPYMVAPSFRSALYRWAGFKGIAEGVYMLGKLDLRGLRGCESNLVIGAHTGLNSHCLFDLGGKITIGKKVHIGHNVMIVTTNHIVGPPAMRCGAFQFGEVVIGDGAWLGAGVMVLPEVNVGPGCVVSAGSVVTKSVPANAMVAGNPARVIGWLDGAQPPVDG